MQYLKMWLTNRIEIMTNLVSWLCRYFWLSQQVHWCVQCESHRRMRNTLQSELLEWAIRWLTHSNDWRHLWCDDAEMMRMLTEWNGRTLWKIYWMHVWNSGSNETGGEIRTGAQNVEGDIAHLILLFLI